MEFSLNAQFTQPDWIDDSPPIAKSLYQDLKSWVDEKSSWDWEYCPRIEASSRILNCWRGQWKTLDLSYLYLTSLPDAFQPLAGHLQVLLLHNQHFEIWPEEINVLKKLKTLGVAGGRLASLTGMEIFPELKELNLRGNQLLSLQDFPKHPKLEKLMVEPNKLINFEEKSPL